MFGAALLSAFTYANVRAVSPTENLEKVNLVSIALKRTLSAMNKSVLQNEIASTKGVTACAINPEGMSLQ